MTLRFNQISAALLYGASCLALTAAGAFAQNKPATVAAPNLAPESPYGGTTVEDILARVNDQIISRSDYDRAMKEMDTDARQKGATLQQISDGHKDLLRNLIDQQLWISKAKELGINGETELIKQLDEIRKKYNLETLEDLEKAAREQGVSYEDFKANIRNQIITQQVMREQVGRKMNVTPGEVQRYFEAHKQEYAQPESVRLSEILIPTGDPAAAGAADDPEKLATAKAKADDIEAKLKAGGNFDQLARSESQGQTAAEGGDLGKYGRGNLNKILEDATFGLQPGQFTEPIRTRQGYVILKVTEHVPGGVPAYKDVEQAVEENYYMSRMEPAMRAYLSQMREEAYIVIKPGYNDTAATANEVRPTISYSSYTPPSPKKKKKAQRTRFRETEHSFRNKNVKTAAATSADTATAQPAVATTTKPSKKKAAQQASTSGGKREKIRYGQAPRETLPTAAETKTEDAGALPKTADAAAPDQANPLEASAAPPEKKTRFAARAKLPKDPKPKGPQLDTFAPSPAPAAEVADRQTQSAPLGLGGNNGKKKKKQSTADAEKTRMQQRPKQEGDKPETIMTPAAPVQGAPAPSTAPKPAVTSPPPSSAPQQTPNSPDPPQSNLPASEPPH